MSFVFVTCKDGRCLTQQLISLCTFATLGIKQKHHLVGVDGRTSWTWTREFPPDHHVSVHDPVRGVRHIHFARREILQNFKAISVFKCDFGAAINMPAAVSAPQLNPLPVGFEWCNMQLCSHLHTRRVAVHRVPTITFVHLLYSEIVRKAARDRLRSQHIVN